MFLNSKYNQAKFIPAKATNDSNWAYGNYQTQSSILGNQTPKRDSRRDIRPLWNTARSIPKLRERIAAPKLDFIRTSNNVGQTGEG